MGYEKIRSIRPLTKLMLELLQDLYHREKNHLQPAAFIDTDLAKGLIARGLMEKNSTRHEDENPYLLTTLGKEYIEHYFGK